MCICTLKSRLKQQQPVLRDFDLRGGVDGVSVGKIKIEPSAPENLISEPCFAVLLEP